MSQAQLPSGALSLDKDQKMDLTKGNAGLKRVILGGGWKAEKQNGRDVDVDLFAVPFDVNGQLLQQPTDTEHNLLRNVCFFQQQSILGGAVKALKGDNVTGAGDGDDEQIQIEFDKIPAEVNSIGLFANIYKADERGQKFGGVKDVHLRLFNADNELEVLGVQDLAEEASNTSGYVFGKVYRHNNEWKYQAASAPVNGDIIEIVKAASGL